METTSYIQEPCCIASTLPKLLRKQNIVVFQHHGDITFQKILDAVSSMCGTDLHITVVTRTLTVPICKHLAWYIRREWVKHITFLTNSEQDTLAMMRENVADCLTSSSSRLIVFSLSQHNDIHEDQLIIQGSDAVVVINGTLLTAVIPGYYSVTAAFTHDNQTVSMLVAALKPYLNRCENVNLTASDEVSDSDKLLSKQVKASKSRKSSKK